MSLLNTFPVLLFRSYLFDPCSSRRHYCCVCKICRSPDRTVCCWKIPTYASTLYDYLWEMLPAFLNISFDVLSVIYKLNKLLSLLYYVEGSVWLSLFMYSTLKYKLPNYFTNYNFLRKLQISTGYRPFNKLCMFSKNLGREKKTESL
jgi:hypothetical protein